MDRIFVPMRLAAMTMKRFGIFVRRKRNGEAVLGWKRCGLREVIVKSIHNGGKKLLGLKYMTSHSIRSGTQWCDLRNEDRSDVVVFSVFGDSAAESVQNSFEVIYFSNVYVRKTPFPHLFFPDCLLV